MTERKSLLTIFDDKMISSYEKLGSYYQKKTHKPASKLIEYCYRTSSLGFAGFAVAYSDYLFGSAITLYTAHKSTRVNHEKQASKYSENEARTIKPVSGTLKILNYLVTTIGVFSLVSGVAQTSLGVTSGDSQSLRKGLGDIGHGIGFLTFLAGNYLERIDFEPPPQRETQSISDLTAS